MIRTHRLALVVATSAVLLAATAHAQLHASFDGTLTGKKLAQPESASAVFIQNGKFFNGTIALPAAAVFPTFGGSYIVQGKGSAKHMKVSGGGGTGGFLTYTAKISGTTLTGNLKIKVSGTKPLKGKLVYTQNVSTTDGSSCDGVYNANQAFFTDQVLATALTICSTCHAPGLQAEAARFRVDATDPLATARSMVQFIDSANPTQSLILEKPENLVSHGGNVQIHPGSTEEMILLQWIDLVAAAHCN